MVSVACYFHRKERAAARHQVCVSYATQTNTACGRWCWMKWHCVLLSMASTCSCVSRHGTMTTKLLDILLISNMYIISTATSAEVVASSHPTASYGPCATNGRHHSTQAISHNNCAIYFWYMFFVYFIVLCIGIKI